MIFAYIYDYFMHIYNSFFSSDFSDVALCFPGFPAGCATFALGCAKICLPIKMMTSLRRVTTPEQASCHDGALTLPMGARGKDIIHSA